MIRFIYTLLLLCTTIVLVTAQLPCIQEQTRTLTSGGTPSQSSIDGTSGSTIAIDGTKTGTWATGNASRTLEESGAWWEIDLGETYALESINIWYPSDVYPEGFSDYYILYSEYPFSGTDLAAELTNPQVNYLHVQASFASGTAFPIHFESARYVRIQNGGGGVMSLKEVDIPGRGKEICGNECDDDGDGFIGCEDSDCRPRLHNVTKVDPSCPICADGSISIQAFGEGNEFSIDGGQTFESACSGIYRCKIDGLLAGDYDILVRNTNECIVEWPGNPIQLKGPLGGLHGHCHNGGFEEGTFEGWTGTYGPWGEHAEGFREEGHTILSSGNDPLIPNIKIPFSGTYTVKLGNAKTGGSQESLTYCFEVDDDNKDFSFNYAVILEDPDETNSEPHEESEKPFFNYSMYVLNAGVQEEIPGSSFKVVSDVDNEFLKKSGDISYKPWTCEKFDLSAYIGEEVCIKFLVADCKLLNHFGYVYIDGLCATNYEPVLSFESKAFYCKNQKIEIDATESYGFDQYTWKVCVLDEQGESIFCAEENVIDTEIELFDASTFIIDNGGRFDCGTRISVELSADNGCSDPVSLTKVIDYLCPEHELSYKDIFICGTEAYVDVLTEGNNDCEGCIYSWEPQLGLDDPTVEFPTIMGSINGNALKQNYVVRATTSEECLYEDTVSMYTFPKIEYIVRDDLAYCERALWVQLIYNQPVEEDWIFVEFENTTLGKVISGRLVNEPGPASVFTYELEVNTTGATLIKTSVGWNVSYEDNIVIELDGDCISEENYKVLQTELFRGEFIDYMKVPNAFTPDLVGNNTFGPLDLNPNPEIGSNVYWAQMQIFNFWGQKVHDVQYSTNEDYSPPHPSYHTPLDLKTIAWDGTLHGKPAASGVYLYNIWFANCTYPDKEANRKDKRIRFTGNVTLFR